MGQSALPEGTAAHRPPPRPSWKIRLDRSLWLAFQTRREPQIGRRKAKKPLGGARQEALAGAIDQAQLAFGIEGENGDINLLHHRAEERGGFERSEALLAKGLTQRVYLAHHLSQSIVVTRPARTNRKILFAQRRQKIGERLQRKDDAMTQRHSEAEPEENKEDCESPGRARGIVTRPEENQGNQRAGETRGHGEKLNAPLKGKLFHIICDRMAVNSSVTPLRAESTLLVLLQTAVEAAAAQSQGLGRLADVSLEPRQRFLDQVALDFFEAHFFQPGWAARIGRAQAQVSRPHNVSLRQEDTPLDGMIELADIPRPRMPLKRLRRGCIKSRHRFPITLGITAQKMVREQRNVLTAFPERRQVNFDGVQAEEQVLPETAGGDFGVDIGVCSGEHAYVHAARFRRAHALHFPCIAGASAMRLGRDSARNSRFSASRREARRSACRSAICVRRIVRRRVFSHGFWMKSRAPRRMASTASSTLPHAVITTTGSVLSEA